MTRARHARTSFIGRHWKALLILVIAIILVVIIAITKPFSGLMGAISNNQSSPKASGSVTLDGQKVAVYATQADAEANKLSVNAETKTLIIPENGRVSVNPSNILASSNGGYTLNLAGCGDQSLVVIKVTTGGNGNFLSQRLSKDLKDSYLALVVSNPNIEANGMTKTSGVPTGKVYFGDVAYETYGSGSEAHQAVAGKQSQFTIPTYMVENGLQLRAEHGNNTARIWVKVCMVGIRGIDTKGIRLNADSNWSGVIDISQFAGYQITLMLHAENGDVTSNGYSYVSFFVPAPIEEQQEEGPDEFGAFG
ncbi:MAG: hypothetical protein IJ867_06335 [Clostridia bacterium]|nr:hypothetical protein [Clostridia bacterium]